MALIEIDGLPMKKCGFPLMGRHNYGKIIGKNELERSTILKMGKSTISMAIFT